MGPHDEAKDTREAETNGADDESLERLIVAARAVGEDVVGLARVALDRARLGARDRAFRLVLWLWLGFVLIAANVLAVHLFLRGLAGGVSALLGGREWAAGLIVGGGLLLVTLAVLGVVRGSLRRSELKRLRRRYPARPAAGESGGDT